MKSTQPIPARVRKLKKLRLNIREFAYKANSSPDKGTGFYFAMRYNITTNALKNFDKKHPDLELRFTYV